MLFDGDFLHSVLVSNHSDIVGDEAPGHRLGKRQSKDDRIEPLARLADVPKDDNQTDHYGRPEMAVEVAGEPADEYRRRDEPDDRQEE